jgi:UPF0755 protein
VQAVKRITQMGIILLILGCVAGVAIWQYSVSYFSAPGPLTESTSVVFAPGTSTRQIVTILGEKQVITQPKLFFAIARLFRYQNPSKGFKAGEYAFSPNVTPRDVYQKLIDGDVVIRKITIPEGLTTLQILDRLKDLEGLTGSLPPPFAEATLLPETYHYTYGDNIQPVVMEMHKRLKEKLDVLWAKRQKGLPFTTVDEALVLASIVEKETGVAEERGRIAAVFVNRLRLGMRLQSDPTVIYVITGAHPPLDRSLTKKDLEVDSPYNTYKYAGLPPAPIAHPGLAAIEAVLNPPTSNELYFVATGNGGHNFASTLAEHNRNVRYYRKALREAKALNPAPASAPVTP